MIQSEVKEEALIRQMSALRPRTHGPDCADRYRAVAEWWTLHAEMSAVPEQAVEYAYNQYAIATDMEARPVHHRLKPINQTRYQWSRLC